MASKVEICNMALLKLGQETIQSFDESSKEASWCRSLYDLIRKAVLRAHPWKFATKTAVLGVLDETDDVYSYVYQLPSDCIRVLYLIDGKKQNTEYEVRGAKLYTDLGVAVLKYVYDLQDAAAFDASFVDAFSYRLASDLAVPLTNNASLINTMTQKYLLEIYAARGIDASEKRKVDTETGSDFLNARE